MKINSSENKLDYSFLFTFQKVDVLDIVSESVKLGKFAFFQPSLYYSFLIAPAYSRVQYRSSNFRPSICSCVRSSVRQHLRRSLVFSTSEIAASLKPCIVIVPDIPFKHAP